MQFSSIQRRWGAIACLQAFISVAAGAFGAHGLKHMVAAQNLEWWQTACQYLMYHSLGSVLAVLLASISVKFLWSARLFTFGNLLFAGSLAVMTMTDIRVLGAVTPIGGVLYLAGWLMMLKSFLQGSKNVVN